MDPNVTFKFLLKCTLVKWLSEKWSGECPRKFRCFQIVNLVFAIKIWHIYIGDPFVPVHVILLVISHQLGVFSVVLCLQYSVRNKVRQLLPFLLIKVDVPGHDEVRVEAGEGVPGRTDGHVGEVQLSDGESLYGGGDWADCPAREGLVDQHSSSCEARDDHTDPEESDETSAGGQIDEAVDGGGLQKLLDPLHGDPLQQTKLMCRVVIVSGVWCVDCHNGVVCLHGPTHCRKRAIKYKNFY